MRLRFLRCTYPVSLAKGAESDDRVEVLSVLEVNHADDFA